MPALKEETSKNPRDYDIPMNERIVYDIIEDAFISIPNSSKLFEKAFFTDKLKELEISFKTQIDNYCSDMLLAMRRSAEARNLDPKTTDIKKLYQCVTEDYEHCAQKISEINPTIISWKVRNFEYGFLKYVTILTNKYIREIDHTINRCLIGIKSVDSTEEVLNKATYTSALYDPDCDWVALSKEQKKLYDEGKEILSKDTLLLNVKKLRSLKARVIRIYNKSFGKDSIYAPFELQDKCK